MLEPWISEEPRLSSVLRHLGARALRRPLVVVGIALACALGSVAARALKAPRHEATAYFLLEEGDLPDPKEAPPPPRDIRQHIAAVALSRRQVAEIMRSHEISVAWLDRDPVAAVEDFRDEIEIGVSRNYFIWGRSATGPPRSARVTVSVAGPEAALTRAILGDIRDAILRDQAAQRAVRLERARALYLAELAQARAASRAIQAELGLLDAAASRAPADERAMLVARAASLAGESRRALERITELERASAKAAFMGAAEENRLGLNLALFDERLVTFAPRLTPAEHAARGAVVFVVALLLTALVVGAFDDRLYGPEDVAARGVPLLGALPRFPGDAAGSFRERSHARRA